MNDPPVKNGWFVDGRIRPSEVRVLVGEDRPVLRHDIEEMNARNFHNFRDMVESCEVTTLVKQDTQNLVKVLERIINRL